MSGVLVLDSEGLAKAVQRDRELHEWLTAARDADLPVITSAAVLVEVIHPKINDAALKWTLSRLSVEPVTRAVAHSAAALLRAAGLHLSSGSKEHLALHTLPGLRCLVEAVRPGRPMTVAGRDAVDYLCDHCAHTWSSTTSSGWTSQG
ncbi:DNA-binding protein [Streptomyces pilosus]|uniref:PIN domain-containing protein n=1 Tax=Streptomyces pilosus TaxID=28893 RepID=A0A918EWX7_9ACTN|nr:DNA-binding protein [Streptomyces pilosus]GGQ74016.1 hypothetical protein GCM10010280_20560 [Streptomyces pilosus]GGV61184.1 hypothetical protein GCM10010261_49860 [Streptomyces pilosus]